MPITELVNDYIPKSRVFLLPALGLKSSQYTRDFMTFIEWKGRFSIHDFKLTVVKAGERNNVDYQKFEKMSLQPSIYFEEMMIVNESLVAYVFNLKRLERDWLHFLSARYSKLSWHLKDGIKNYYSGYPEWELIRSFLYPEEYFDIYAELLYDPRDRSEGLKLIKSVGELCNPFDPEKEIFNVIPNSVEVPSIII